MLCFFLAVQDLKEEIDIRLSRVQDIKYEPRLLAEDDGRLLQLETPGTVPEVPSRTCSLGAKSHLWLLMLVSCHMRWCLCSCFPFPLGGIQGLQRSQFVLSLYQAAITTCTG